MELLIEGPGIASSKVYARTRPGPAIVLPVPRGEPGPKSYTYYGANFEHVAARSIPVVGMVKDKDTGQPLPGVTVCSVYGELEFAPYYEELIQTTTDAGGRFRLAGVPIGKDRELAAHPPMDQPYLSSEQKVAVPADKDSLEVDFELKRGIWIRGKVTDARSGEPLSCNVEYYAFRDNPHAKAVPGFTGGWPTLLYRTDSHGHYAVPGLPGRGIVAADGNLYVRYHYPSGQGAEHIPGAHVSKYAGGAAGMMMYDAYPNRCLPELKTALAEVSPSEGAQSVHQDFCVAPGQMLTGTVLDPEGKPLAGVNSRAATETPMGRFGWPGPTSSRSTPTGRTNHAGCCSYTWSGNWPAASSSRARSQDRLACGWSLGAC